jgi:hypothetical protein
MSFRGNFGRGLAALTLAAGSTALAAGAAIPANAATPACGHSCVTLYSQIFGAGDVMAVLNGVDAVGQAAIVTTAGPDSDEDFLSLYEGTVASVYADGLVSSVADQAWPSDAVYEYEYAPDGVLSGLCLGTALTASAGVPVGLQPCGITSTVMWIPLPQPAYLGDGFTPLVNGSDTSATSVPVLDVGALNDQLTIQTLHKGPKGPSPSAYEMWQDESGVL